MPWKVYPVSELRLALVHAVRSADLSIAEAARRFGVSRKTAHKWVARHNTDPLCAFTDRSRRPLRSPGKSSDESEQAVLRVRDRYGWGPRKIHAVLHHQRQPTPTVRTIATILKRHGRVGTGNAAVTNPPQRFERTKPNELWQLDFKGPVEVQRRRISPLTILDDHSRYLLALKPCLNQTYATVQAVLWDLFGDVGLPEAILSDNAFSARNTGVGLSQFDAWLIRLGIHPLHGRPYHPETQGKVERLNGTLERELLPKARRDSLPHFEADLERWRPVYNTVRPHEAIGDQPPHSRWRPSERLRPREVPEVQYPTDAELRTISQTGDIRYHRARILVGRGLAGERVRVVENGSEIEIYYSNHRVRSVAKSQLEAHAWT